MLKSYVIHKYGKIWLLVKDINIEACTTLELAYMYLVLHLYFWIFYMNIKVVLTCQN